MNERTESEKCTSTQSEGDATQKNNNNNNNHVMGPMTDIAQVAKNPR